MSKVDFQVDEPIAITEKVKLMEIGFKNAVEKAMIESTFLVEKSAKERVPHITGRLRRSIRGGITNVGRGFVEGTVGANTVYAAAVEFGRPNKKGGGTTSGKPYLSRAVTENKAKIQRLISDGLKKTLRGFKI